VKSHIEVINGRQCSSLSSTSRVLLTLNSLNKAKNSRGSSVGIALGYGLDDRGSTVQFPAEAGNFSLTTVSRMALGPAQPPIQCVPGAFSQGIKRPECEADNSPPSIAEVKNAWSYTSTPPIRLHSVVLC
jgi:hypothetical protein